MSLSTDSASSSASLEQRSQSIPGSVSSRGDQTDSERISGVLNSNSVTDTHQPETLQPTDSTPSPSLSPSPLPSPLSPQPEPPNPQPEPPNPQPEPPNPEPQNLPVNHHSMQTRSKNNIQKPKTKYSLTIRTTPTIPTTLNQALRDPRWRNTISTEFNAVTANHTYLVPPAPNQNVIDTNWIHTIKHDGRLKSRIVARGYNQQYGIDYAETFSPVIKSTTVRLVLEHAVRHDWTIRQLDVNNAFLQGTLQDEVYVSQPPGFIDKDWPTHVCRLRKALYGLKQAPRAWYEELKRALCSMGFRNSLADTSLFIYCQGQQVVYILVYVDDILVTGSNLPLVNKFIATLASRFFIKDLGHISYLLGIEATRSSAGLHLMQHKYILDLLAKTKMEDAKPVSTPMATHRKLTLSSGALLLLNPTDY